jgi:hypothetical protein
MHTSCIHYGVMKLILHDLLTTGYAFIHTHILTLSARSVSFVAFRCHRRRRRCLQKK